MLMSFFTGNQMSQFRVDLVHRLTQEKASQLLGIIFTLVAFPAETEIHHPKMVCRINKVVHYLGWEHVITRIGDGFIDG